jgi:AcrR family transcriptional regulator
MPRAGLSQDVVVAEAARIADEVGYDQLTLAAVAGHFGVAVPSLYKHVAGLDALRGHIAARAIAELGAEISTAVARGGATPLRALAAAYRGYARAHPGRYAATLRAPGPGNPEAVAMSQNLLDTVYEVLTGYGLPEEDLVDATRSLRSVLHGFVALEQAGGFGLPRDIDHSFDRLIALFDGALRSWAATPTRSKPPTG